MAGGLFERVSMHTGSLFGLLKTFYISAIRSILEYAWGRNLAWELDRRKFENNMSWKDLRTSIDEIWYMETLENGREKM